MTDILLPKSSFHLLGLAYLSHLKLSNIVAGRMIGQGYGFDIYGIALIYVLALFFYLRFSNNGYDLPMISPNFPVVVREL